jgi:hypothetical protein
MRPADTSPEAWKVFLDLQRRMPPEEKLARALELSESIRWNVEASIRRRHPEASEGEIFLRIARHMLGQDLFRKVYNSLDGRLSQRT